MNTYALRGFNKTGTKFLSEDLEADSQADAIRKFRELHPDAGSLSCRCPDHKSRIFDQMMSLPLLRPAHV